MEVMVVVIFLVSSFMIEKIIDRFIYSIENNWKCDTKSLFEGDLHIKKYLKKWWIVITAVLSLSILMTYAIITYFKMILTLIVLVGVCIYLYLDYQQQENKNKRASVTQLLERIIHEVLGMIQSKSKINVDMINSNFDLTEFIFLYTVEASFLFDEMLKEQFSYLLIKKFRQESSQLKWLNKKGNSMLKIDVSESGLNDLTIMIAICSNDATKSALERYYEKQKENNRPRDIDDEDF